MPMHATHSSQLLIFILKINLKDFKPFFVQFLSFVRADSSLRAEKKLLFSFWARTVLLIKAHEKKYELIESKPELNDAVFCSTPKIKLAIAKNDLFIEFS